MKFEITNDYKNIREFLKEELMLSKKNIHTINMDKNNIFLNDELTNLYKELKIGDILEINLTLSTSNYLKNNEKEITIEYEDDFILVASKPFGMKTHPNDNGIENDTLVNFLINDFEYLEPIHRLDIDTCGLVIFAKTPFIKAKLDYMLENKEIMRFYSAIVKNNINTQKISTNIGRDNRENNKMTVTKNGKIAITNILECEKLNNGFYKLLISLETGRTHQIRVHLNYLNNGIVGDKLYSKDGYKYDNMYLGALKLEFIHPIYKKKIVINSHFKKLFNNI